MPDFNIDSLKLSPDQNDEARVTECTGETIADIMANATGVPMDPGFAYAAGFAVSGITPSTVGEDPFSVMQGAVAYGSLPASDENFTALTKGELFEANFANYSPQEKTLALTYARNGVKTLNDFQSVLTHVYTTKTGAALAMTWYELLDASNVLVAPLGGQFTNHCVEAVGQKTVGGVPCLIIKSWQGPSYGDGGYCYLSEVGYNNLVQGAYGFDLNATRWWSLLGIACTRYPYLLSYLPSLASAGSNVQTANGNKVYETAKSLLGTHVCAMDATTDWGVLGCAATVNKIVQEALGAPIGGGASTNLMWQALKDATKYQPIAQADALAGDIIISPTGSGGPGSLSNGHVGVCGLFGILSNNYETGTLQENFTIPIWLNYFSTYGGLQTLFFRVL